MIEIKPPGSYEYLTTPDAVTMFLGGSIEMGKAEKWQDEVVKRFAKRRRLNILNPRRDDWDSSWDQSPIPGTKFHEQVTWELSAQERSDVICYYFAKDTMSPITLLEMGLFGRYNSNKQIVVYVDKDYQRRGNVIVTCNYYGIIWHDDFETFIGALDLAIKIQSTSKEGE